MPVRTLSSAFSLIGQNSNMYNSFALSYVSFFLFNFTDFDGDFPVANKIQLIKNYVAEKTREREVIRITYLLRSCGCEPIHFKGTTLAYRLYEEQAIRPVGDIDFYIDIHNFADAIDCLIKDGYDFLSDIADKDPQHAVMTNGEFCIEVHKYFFPPEANVNEAHILHMRESVVIGGVDLTTLTPTGTLLLLLYHQYGHIVTDASIQILLFPEKMRENEFTDVIRYIDIVRLIDKYKENIEWNEFCADVNRQNLSIHFFKIISEIQTLFPGTFPDFVLNSIDVSNHCTTESMRFYYDVKELLENNPRMSTAQAVQTMINLGHVGPKFIVDNQNSIFPLKFSIDECAGCVNNPNGTYIIRGEKPQNSSDFSCEFGFLYNGKDLILGVQIHDDKLVFNTGEKSPSFGRDSVCVRIASTTMPYCYKSILLCPVIRDGKTICLAYETDNEDKNVSQDIKSVATLTEDGYIIMVEMGTQYLSCFSPRDKSIKFYMDIQINDCDDETQERKTALSFSCSGDNWYDPRAFACFDLSVL